MSDRTDRIREIAKKWLADGIVEAVVGWTDGTYGDKTSPVLIRKPEEADRLVFHERCTNNLVTYLRRDPVRGMKSVGIVVKGCDRQMVGEFAARVRLVRRPEPYQGKGIRYVGEVVRRKAGKAFAGTAT